MQSEELEVKQGLVANSSTQSRMLANNENHGVNEVSVNNLPPVLVAHPILVNEIGSIFYSEFKQVMFAAVFCIDNMWCYIAGRWRLE